MYYNFKNINIKPIYNNILLIASVLIFAFFPVAGDTINIITNTNRIIFCILSFLIVLGSYKLTVILPSKMAFILETLGIATYGVYMFHPVIYNYLTSFAPQVLIQNYYIKFLLVVTLTILIAIFSYYKFELPLSNYGKKIINKYLK